MKRMLSIFVYVLCGAVALPGLVFAVIGGCLVFGALYGSKLADYLSSEGTWDDGVTSDDTK